MAKRRKISPQDNLNHKVQKMKQCVCVCVCKRVCVLTCVGDIDLVDMKNTVYFEVNFNQEKKEIHCKLLLKFLLKKKPFQLFS